MDTSKLQKMTITREQIREVYDQGPEAVEALVFSLVDKINYLIDKDKEQDLRIKKLEDQLSKNSRNSSKPPSSDSPFEKKKGQKPRKSAEKQKRTGRTLKQVENPDEIISHKVHICEHCQSDLSGMIPQEIDKRQVTDIPPIKACVTEHQGEIKTCPHCHKVTRAAFPDGVTHKAQYGSRIQAVAVYIRNYQLVPLERAKELFKDLFKVSISEGTLVNMTTRCANKLSDFMGMMKQELIAAEVQHNDETGIYIGGILHWRHTAGNQNYTYLFPHKRRGAEAFDAMGILSDFKGVSVHDFWKPYEKYGCSHAYCNAHLIRELIFVLETMGQKWAGKMIRLMLKMKEAVDESEMGCLTGDIAAGFTKEYERIIRQAYKANKPPKNTGKRGRPKKGKVLSLIERLDKYQNGILRFMREEKVPFDNNLAERDLRMVKVRQKISGGFRNMSRVNDYCRIRSYISTLKKQGKDIFAGLIDIFEHNREENLVSYS